MSAIKENMVSLPIGVFDSGVGGLSVLLALCDLLPNERFVFFADEAHLPYGDKPQHEIAERVVALSHFFKNMPVKAMVIACNTATAAAADQVRQIFPNWPIVGIEPAVKPAALLTQSGRVGILATSNTLASERFRSLVQRFDDVAQVFACPCSGLVELIEQSPLDLQKVRALLAPHVEYLLAEQVDVIVLGCTHYPFVANVIAELAGPNIQIIETGAPVAKQLLLLLEKNNLVRDKSITEGNQYSGVGDAVLFLTSGSPEGFKLKLSELMGDKWTGAQILSYP
jgi:glutamate racemase